MSQYKVKILEDFAEQISPLMLPTNGAVIKAIYFEKDCRNIKIVDAIKVVCVQICELWQRAMIPIVSQQRIQKKIADYFDKYTALLKTSKDIPTKKSKIELFKVINYYKLLIKLIIY